ncbi:MAG: type 1 glutamine amidotransferase domain-containing protein [Vicingaceae bacterium]
MNQLEGKKVAILATDGFEESELIEPQKALKNANVETDIISLETGEIRGWKNGNWSDSIAVDQTVDDVKSDDYDALMLPGGVINPDKLRRSESAVVFVRNFFKQSKPVAAICHGPQLLIEADVVKDRKMTSFSSIRKDLENAGAKWVDKEVVVDHGLVTSRSPKDLPVFNAKLVEEVWEGKHQAQTI